MRARTARLAAISVLALGILFGAAPVASADHHLVKVREFSIGAMGTNDSFIELQMYEAGQNFMTGKSVQIFDAAGTDSTECFLSGPIPPNDESQRTVLIAEGVAGADYSAPTGVCGGLDDVLEGEAAGGALCFNTTTDPAGTTDCVSWGTFSGEMLLPSPAGTPITGPLVAGTAYRRPITGGSCATALDAADDTNNSATDFAAVMPPGPTPNSATPGETVCTPPPVTTGPPAVPSAGTPGKKKRVRRCKKKPSRNSVFVAKKKRCKRKRRGS
jgi:hypothetical protein